VMESAVAADTVLQFEKKLSYQFPSDQKYAFESRNGLVIRQYSSAYTRAYNDMMGGMVERRMRESIYATASFWYTAWVDAGQPDLNQLSDSDFSEEDKKEIEQMEQSWRTGTIKGRSCD